MKLSQTVFVVTGAGSGIGASLTHELVAHGAHVAAIDIHTKNLEALRANSPTPNSISIHTVDITNKDQVAALPDEVRHIHGSVDGLINCAGIIQPFVKVTDLSYDDIERVMNVNFYGTLYMTKAFLPHLLQRPEASLTNISSMGGFLPVPGQSVYGASKAAVKLLTEGLYAELEGTSVHVSVVFPGATKTNIARNSKLTTSTDKQQAAAIPMLSPQKAASIIVRAIERNTPLIFTGSDSRLMNFLYRLSPVFATRFIAKRMRSLLK